jgi:uroporphyrinogen-III synthase
MPPAPGQGALAVQVRADDERTLELVGAIDHTPTRVAVEAERAFLHATGGGCRAPIGAFATVDSDTVEIIGGRVAPDGSGWVIRSRRGPVHDPVALGQELAAELGLAERTRGTEGFATERPRVLVTRAKGQADALLSAMRDEGLEPIAVPAIAVDLEAAGSSLDEAARRLATYRWAIVTSANGARAIVEAAKRVRIDPGVTHWAAVGDASARVLAQAVGIVEFVPSDPTSGSLATELPITHDDPVLLIRGNLAGDRLATNLRARGAIVDEVIGYRTREAPTESRAVLRTAVDDGPIAAIVFTSGSTARGLRSLADAESIDLSAAPAICIGDQTADAAREAGFRVLAVAPAPDAATLASTAAAALIPQLQETR